MGLEEILKQVEETGRERAAAIIKETTNEVESKMAEARAKESIGNAKRVTYASEKRSNV